MVERSTDRDRPAKLVVADDDPQIRQMLGSILKRDGYDVCLAANGAEAIAMAHEVVPDLVILDYMMPDLDGGRAAAVLKAAEVTRDIPILLLSAIDNLPDSAESGEACWDYRAEKPFTPKQLKDRIAEILSSTRERPRRAAGEDAPQTSDIARPMRDGYAEALRNTVAEMQVELDQAHQGRARTTVLESVRRRFHQIRGSAATFGFPGIGEVAAEAETVVRDWLGSVDGSAELDLERVRTALQRIGELLKVCDPPRSAVLAREGTRAERRGTPEQAAVTGRVLLLHTDRDFLEQMSQAAARRGYDVEALDSPVATLERLRTQAFEIVTIGGQPAQQSDCEWARAIRRESGEAALVLVGGDGATEHRVTAAKAGVDRYIAGTPKGVELVREWEDLSAVATTRVGRVMVVDDDPAVLAFVEANLRRLGCEVVCLNDAVGVFESLERSRPDLLILDVDMPAANGLEVTQAIRASQAWGGLPIVIQTAHTSPEYRLRAFESGADDFITKPILEEELSARVLGRLERERAKDDRTHRDPVTDLVTGERFPEAVSTALGHAPGAAAATLEVRGLERLVARRGPAAGDAAMRSVAHAARSAFRSNRDVLGRVAPHVIALVAPGITLEEAAARLESCLRELEHDERLCPSGSPADGVEVEASVVAMGCRDEVGRVLERALGGGRSGRRCRLRIEQGSAVVASNRVYLVEDDPNLRQMLVFALENAGYQVGAFASGHDALRVLTRVELGTEPPLVLLDVELPGIDGFQVLEELTRERPGAFRVVMLTANDGAQERMRALRCGASDFIAKPLRIPELVSKVARVSVQAAPGS